VDNSNDDRGPLKVTIKADGAFMSRAFVKETDETFDDLPDRPISAHPNFVTKEGLAAIEATLVRLQQEHARAAGDRAALAAISRETRYWISRRSTAQVVAAPPDPARVQFGCTVTILRADASQQTYRIVGEDEADPSRGTISYVSPMARALMGREIGDIVQIGKLEVELVSIA
jgi:transcription elongation GreA/GreB family factor